MPGVAVIYCSPVAGTVRSLAPCSVKHCPVLSGISGYSLYCRPGWRRIVGLTWSEH